MFEYDFLISIKIDYLDRWDQVPTIYREVTRKARERERGLGFVSKSL